jgi:hypothetical protein
MTNSSAPLDYSTTSSSDVGFIAQEITTILPDTITLTGSNYYNMSSSGVVSIGGSGSSGTYTIGSSATVSLNDINASTFTWKTPEEFVDAFPDYDRVQKMCDQYPGLKIAYEKFATTYNIVKDDYDHPKDKK